MMRQAMYLLRKVFGIVSWPILSFLLSYGSCERCRISWIFNTYHITDTGGGTGIFSLCEACWTDLQPNDRMPFYFRLYDRWEPESRTDERWYAIHDAVKSDK